MLLRDFILLRSNTIVLCKGFIDGITQYKNVAKLWSYANNHAVNEIIGLLFTLISQLSTKDLELLWKFGDDLDTFYTETYSDDIKDVPWGNMSIKPETTIVLNKVSNVLDEWRLTNGWEDPGWVSNTWENITTTETDTDVEYPVEAKNYYDHQPPYVNTMITQSGTTLVLIIQRNKTEICQPLLNVAVTALGLRSDLDTLYPAVGIGTIAASILFMTLQKLRYMPIKRVENESNFQNTLNVASNVMKTVLSNINILNETDCHPRLRSHSVIKFVGNDVMISLAKVIETGF